jgi:hypothetical protein
MMDWATALGSAVGSAGKFGKMGNRVDSLMCLQFLQRRNFGDQTDEIGPRIVHRRFAGT